MVQEQYLKEHERQQEPELRDNDIIEGDDNTSRSPAFSRSTGRQAVAESSATDADATSHATEDSAGTGKHSTRIPKKMIHLNLAERRTNPHQFVVTYHTALVAGAYL